MDAVHWEKIRKNLDAISNVYPEDIVRDLYQDDVIDESDRNNLLEITAYAECMLQLCFTLKKIHPEKEPYWSFLKALKKAKYSKLADKIDNTETNSDGSVSCEVDPKYFEAKARRIIDQHFVNKRGAETPLSEFMDILCHNNVFKGGGCWTNEDLSNFIEKYFVGTEKIVKTKGPGNRRSKKIYIKNVAKLEKMEQVLNTSGMTGKENLSDTLQMEWPTNIEDLDAHEISVLLQGYFNKKKMNCTPLLEMENNEVNGQVLLSMTEDDIMKAAPSVSFGVCRSIKFIIDEYKKSSRSEASPSLQCVRKFCYSTLVNEYYVIGKCVSLDVNIQEKEKRTSRVKNFCLVENKTEVEICESIAVEVILFAAACVNERRNGTIYFGINPQATQSHQEGEIVGMVLPKDELQDKINEFFGCAFHKKQMELMKNIVSPVKFVPAVNEDKASSCEQEHERWVIEYDIEPSNAILGEEFVKIDPKQIPCLKKKLKAISCVVRFSKNGKPKLLKFDEEQAFEAEKSEIINQRNLEEKKYAEKETSNLHDRLQNLITSGYPHLEDDIFPFLVLDSLSADTGSNTHSLQHLRTFIKHLRPEVVFDFDQDSSPMGIYHELSEDENLRILTLDNFDVKNSDGLQTSLETLSNEKNRMWVFCNGYSKTDMKHLTATEWKMKRRFAFYVCLERLLSIFIKERILLIVCLFSENERALIEACDQALSLLPCQWLLLAESDHAVQVWQDNILQRDLVEKREDLLDRCFSGMTWEHISTCFKNWCRCDEFKTCCIPHSNGSLIEVEEKLLKNWTDIELLSASDPCVPNGNEGQVAKAVEERFYRGGPVEWLNFWFKDQVLERDIYQHLKNEVEKALTGDGENNEEKVTSPVFLYHQPGAGGTTLAKHILWQLRKDYRCCIVHDITKYTCDQLEEIYLLRDDQPKPLLLLLDNTEFEIFQKYDLELKGQKILSKHGGSSGMFCVLLICRRCASLPLEKYTSHLKVLRQELNPQEQNWFKTKFNLLEQRHNENERENVDPQFLISFNLLKENFDRKYLKDLVQRYIKEIPEKEIEIMKVVSLLNAFDPDFNQLPVYLFDVKLCTDTYIFQNTSTSYAKMSRRAKWEACVSQGFKILLNISTGNYQQRQRRKTVRIFNQLLAKEILQCICQRTEQSVFDLMLELLNSNLLEEENKALKIIHETIRNVIIKRQHKIVHNDIKKEQFSQLILDVQRSEGPEKAIEILTTFYRRIQDPFVAQHIARFYMEEKKFALAEEYARFAVEAFPNNSYLLDTYGQVFFNQLSQLNKDTSNITREPSSLSDEEVGKFNQLHTKCVKFFRKSQEATKKERGHRNMLGYIDELRSNIIFIDGLRKLSPESEEIFNRYLVEDGFRPESLKLLESTCVKSIYDKSHRVIQILNEVFVSEDSQELVDEFSKSDMEEQRKKFWKLKMRVEESFGENKDEVPSYLNEHEQCEYRYRRVKSKGIRNLKYLLRKIDDEEQLKRNEESFHLMLANVNSLSCRSVYLKTILDIVTVLMIQGKIPPQVSYEEILTWSEGLCFGNYPEISEENIYLEKYFYFFIFHFPTPERNLSILSNSGKRFVETLDRWQHDHQSKSENLQKESRQTHTGILFFIGKGKPLEDLVCFENVTKITNFDDLLSQKKEKLKIMTGTLREGGTSIHFFVTCKDEEKHFCDIPTLHSIDKTMWWQKEVYFYLGFCFSGPKAFCVTDTKPEFE